MDPWAVMDTAPAEPEAAQRDMIQQFIPSKVPQLRITMVHGACFQRSLDSRYAPFACDFACMLSKVNLPCSYVSKDTPSSRYMEPWAAPDPSSATCL